MSSAPPNGCATSSGAPAASARSSTGTAGRLRSASCARPPARTLRTGERDLHSGMFGGAALNAAHAMLTTLNALVAQDGLLVESLRKGIAVPTAEELEGWSELPSGADELAEQGARPKDRRAAE